MTGDFGYGQFDPWTANDDANTIHDIVWSILAGIETARIVEVIAVTPGAGTPPAAGTVDVRILVNQIDGLGNAVPHDTAFGIPYLRLGGGDSAVVIDPAVGDVGLVICDARDTSNARSTRKQANPGSRRMFDFADGVYVGALFAADLVQYLWFSADGVTLLDRNGNGWVGSASGIDVTPKSGHPHTIHGDSVVTGSQTIDGASKIDGNLEVDGTTDLKGSVHAEAGVTVDGALAALTLALGGTAVIKRALTGSFSFASVLNASFSGSVGVTGVKSGDFVIPNFSVPVAAPWFFSTSANTVTLTLVNTTGAPFSFSVAGTFLVFGTT